MWFFVEPEDDILKTYVFPVSSAATACFSAVLFKAARIYQTLDDSLSERCLNAAKQAYKWLTLYPENNVFKNPDGVLTGEYGVVDDAQSRFWAAVEGYVLTESTSYHKHIQDLLNQCKEDLYKGHNDWEHVGILGVYAYLDMKESAQNPKVKDMLNHIIDHITQDLLDMSKKNRCGIGMRDTDFCWGSNMHIMTKARHLLFSYEQTQSKDVLELAHQHLSYLLGANFMDTCYITGFGERSPKSIHHRPSMANQDEEPLCGFVVGGPNANLEDPWGKERVYGAWPDKCYIDIWESYSTNEVATYWNSPALLVLLS